LEVAVEDRFAGDWLVDAVFAVVFDSRLLDQVDEAVSSRLKDGCCAGPEEGSEWPSGEWTAEVEAAVPPRSP
jgi:hypothetical protein